MKRVLATLLAAALPCSALADDMFYNYIGIHGVSLDQGEPFTSLKITDSVSTTDAFLKWGGVINKYVGAELRLGGTIGDDEVSKPISATVTQTITVSNDWFGGAYLRLQYPMSWLTVYAQAGMVRMKTTDLIETDGAADNSITDRFTDSSYAWGADLNFGDRWILSGEYYHLSDYKGTERAGPSVGVSYRF